MAKQKYNFDKIKQEFFDSDYQEVKSYFEDKFDWLNAHIAKNTLGWTKDKKNYIKDQISKANAIYEKERQKKWIKVMRNIDVARMAWIQELWTRLATQEKVTKLQVREITEALKRMRLELWESTENIKEETNNPLLEKLKEIDEKSE